MAKQGRTPVRSRRAFLRTAAGCVAGSAGVWAAGCGARGAADGPRSGWERVAAPALAGLTRLGAQDAADAGADPVPIPWLGRYRNKIGI